MRSPRGALRPFLFEKRNRKTSIPEKPTITNLRGWDPIPSAQTFCQTKYKRNFHFSVSPEDGDPSPFPRVMLLSRFPGPWAEVRFDKGSALRREPCARPTNATKRTGPNGTNRNTKQKQKRKNNTSSKESRYDPFEPESSHSFVGRAHCSRRQAKITVSYRVNGIENSRAGRAGVPIRTGSVFYSFILLE